MDIDNERGHGAGPATARRRRRGAAFASPPAGLLLALALAWVAPDARAQQQPAGPQDTPQPERSADAPPVGVRIAPDLTLSGYATTQLLAPLGTAKAPGDTATAPAQVAEAPANSQFSRRTRLDLSHLSAIAWWEPAPAWKLLGEVDLQDVVQLPEHDTRADGRDSSPYASLERLYADYRASDAASLRAGKFLTPIGRWNQDHSDPQTWTVLRPLISQSAFPTNITGVMAFGSVPVASQWVDYQVYASDGGEWRASPYTASFDHAIGGRVSTSLAPQLQVGVSLSRFAQSDYESSEFFLSGIDAVWSWHRAEISAEAVQRRSRASAVGSEHGWFVQAALPLAERWWAVARLEAYKRTPDESTTRSALAGLVYKSGRHWVFKAEWVQPSSDAQGLPSGFLSSLTLAY